MKKAIFIILLAALLSGCANTAEEEKAVTSAVSQTTTTAAETASETVTTSETTTTTRAVTTAETTSTSKAITTSKTETATLGTTSKSTTKKVVSESTTTQRPIQQIETYVIYYDESAPETQQPEVKVTEAEPITTTTVQTTPPTTTTTAPPTTTTTAQPSGVEWSESMKVWRKLCEGKQLSGGEQDIIRNEILEYAMQTFNGRTNIHVKFGIDEHDITYGEPLNLIINQGLIGMENAHFDAYADPDSKWLIDYATSEQEVYKIVCETRKSCLHIIDYGLFNRWEMYSVSGALKYASDIEFNVGFDKDMTIWFLTQV